MGLCRAKMAAIAALVAAALVCAPARAATINASAQANIVKPLALKSIQDLDLGTVLLGQGIWSGAVLSLSMAGALTCPANVTCSGATQVAQYNVQGSNKQTVTISAPDVVMVNQANASKKLTLKVSAPASVYLPNSGQPGVNFNLGGSITLDSTTAAGVYVGTFEVTANYQ